MLTKGTEYEIMKNWLGLGLLLRQVFTFFIYFFSTGDKWRSRRKMLTPAFHFSILNSFVPIYDKEAQVRAKKN